VKVKGQFGDGGDGRVNRPPGVGEGMADQRREQMLQAALEVIVERGPVRPQPRGGRGPAEVRRAAAGDDPVAGAGRAGRREFAAVDAEGFAITLSTLLDGFAVPIALGDPQVTPARGRVVDAVPVRPARIPLEPAARPQLSRR
jgi:hypothetical protein